MLYPRSLTRRAILLSIVALLFGCVAGSAPAAAHPLGNFTVNLYSRLVVQPARIDLRYVVDMAEIPSFQLIGAPPTEQAALDALREQLVGELVGGIELRVDGKPTRLEPVNGRLLFPVGQGGLATTRLEVDLVAALPGLDAGGERRVEYHDRNYAERLGWHEVVVVGDGVALRSSDVPAQDRSDELRAYPQDLLSTPPDQRSAMVLVVPGASRLQPRSAGMTTPLAVDRFAGLIAAEQLSLWTIVLALALALGLGALHALSPGHGKTVVAAYLVGARGTARHAVFLGATVTITHTLGVFALGLITLYASQFVLTERLYPWLGVVSGALVLIMGLALLRRRVGSLLRWRGERRPQRHGSSAHAHEHHHGSGYDHHEHGPHTHTHLPPVSDASALSWHSMLALGVSGGLVPCPSALVVMLSAISLGRIGYGLVLIVAFSLGLATTLTVIGLLFVHGSRWLMRAGNSGRGLERLGVVRVLPIVSASLVTVAGLLITAQALAQAQLLP